MTTVVNLLRRKFTLYIGREWRWLPESKWHNPFPLSRCSSREQCLAYFKEWIRTQTQLMADLHEIDDQVLGCFCRPEACHGDVLIKLRKEQLELCGSTVHIVGCACGFCKAGFTRA